MVDIEIQVREFGASKAIDLIIDQVCYLSIPIFETDEQFLKIAEAIAIRAYQRGQVDRSDKILGLLRGEDHG